MEMLLEIGLTIVGTIVFGLLYLVFNFFRSKYLSKKYIGYDRYFSITEKQYFSESKAVINELYRAPPKFPKWYSWFLYTAFVPTIFFTVFIAFIAWMPLVWLATKELHAKYSNAFLLETVETSFVGFSFFFIMFSCVFFAGWLLYYLTGFFEKMALFVAMKSDAHGFNEDAIEESHILRLEHDIRAHKLLTNEPFEPRAFIIEKSAFYRQVFGWLGLAILLPGLVFAIFDLRQFTAVTSEGLFMRSSYLSKDIKQLSFSDIEIVKFRCHIREDGEQHVSYDLFLNKEDKVEIRNIVDKIDGVFELDMKLRQASVKIRPYISSNDGGEKYLLEKTCVDAVTSSVNIDKIESVFHLSEYLGAKP